MTQEKGVEEEIALKQEIKFLINKLMSNRNKKSNTPT